MKNANGKKQMWMAIGTYLLLSEKSLRDDIIIENHRSGTRTPKGGIHSRRPQNAKLIALGRAIFAG